MIIISVKTIEKMVGRKVIPFITGLGIDVASRTGWCQATTNPDTIELDYGFINVDTNDKYFKYDRYIEFFTNFLKPHCILIIEESFYGRNVKSFQMLSRLGGFIYAIAHLVPIREKKFMLATTARKNLGLPAIKKKEEVHQVFLKKTKIELNDKDIIDAIILALNGVLE